MAQRGVGHRTSAVRSVAQQAEGNISAATSVERTGLMDARGTVPDRAFARILGQEIRLVREAKGLTRAQLVERLPSRISDRTLLSYEHGVRYLTVMRFAEICRTLEVSPSEVLTRASEKASDLRAFSLKVNLGAVVRDTQDGFEPVRLWAKNRLDDEDRDTEVLLSPGTVREMAAVLGFSHSTLATYLAEFSEDLTPE